MTKDEFKKRWDSNDQGGGITFDDIADCAKAWGLFSNPKTRKIEEVRDVVLEAAGCKMPDSQIGKKNNGSVANKYIVPISNNIMRPRIKSAVLIARSDEDPKLIATKVRYMSSDNKPYVYVFGKKVYIDESEVKRYIEAGFEIKR